MGIKDNLLIQIQLPNLGWNEGSSVEQDQSRIW
jgi:hypothetical protein